jgi:hypothetical protein
MQVTIQKRGDRPARITVTQGEKLWRTTERELDMLPPPAREYAARLLGQRLSQLHGRGADATAEVRHFELRLDEQGELQIEGDPSPQGADVRRVPGGVQIEIREGDDRPRIRWRELRRPTEGVDRASEGRLREQLERLQRELRERAEETPPTAQEEEQP